MRIPAVRSSSSSIVATLLALVGWSGLASAQRALVGVHLGGTSARMHYSGQTSQHVRSASGGALLTLEASRWLAVQVEALGVVKGGLVTRLDANRVGSGYSVATYARYLEFPTVLRVSTPFALRTIRPYLVVGRYDAWPAGCGEVRRDWGSWPRGPNTFHCPDGSHDAGMITGFGATYDRGRFQAAIDARRNRSTDVVEVWNYGRDARSDTRTIAMRVAFAIPRAGPNRSRE